MSEGLDIGAHIKSGGFDYLDFGCSSGASLAFGKNVLGGVRGLGVDIDTRKIELSRAAGHDVILGDASALACQKKSVRFVTMLHFLEHLPGAALAEKCVRSACRASRDFIYIRHPWFDSDFDLYRMGYKFYWSDWTAHPTHLTAMQLHAILLRIKDAREWTMFGRGRIRDLSSKSIIPRDAPRDSQAAPAIDLSRAAPLPFIAYAELAVLVRLGDAAPYAAARAALADHEALA